MARKLRILHPCAVYGVLFCSLWVCSAFGESPVTITVHADAPGYTIPPDFTGVSIFTGTQVAGHRGVPGNLFSATNTQLITLFTNSAIHHLRLGATGGAESGTSNLAPSDIDSLFAFAKATGIKVIFSLHARDAVAAARYVWTNYRPYLDRFAFDNEPDGRWDADGWRSVATNVTAALPGATFAGPDAAGRGLVPEFIDEEKTSGIVTLLTQHIYVGGNPRKRGVATAQQAIDNMLSEEWATNKYPQLYHDVFVPAAANKLTVRLTESDDYVHGVTNASDAFASSLWALDYMHWWAAHGAAGVNFQNTEWLRTDTFHPDADGNYQIYPKAYAIKAFDLGGHGSVKPVSMSNTDGLNLTAYAVGEVTNLYVTIVNKEHSAATRDAKAAIELVGFVPASAAAMYLTAPNNDVGATNGITLGGAPITNNAPWRGQWTPLPPPAQGRYLVTVPAASAAVVKFVRD